MENVTSAIYSLLPKIQGLSRKYPAMSYERGIYRRRYKKHCTWDNEASVPFKVGTLGPHIVPPVTISCPVVLSWISLTVWNLFPFKGDFSFGKSQKEFVGCQIWAIEGLSHLDDLMFCHKTLHKMWCVSGHIVLMKLPITSCPQLRPFESSEYLPQRNVQA